MKLNICETFYSIQGEGPSVGTPALFLRLSGCNLKCAHFDAGCDTFPLWQESQSISFQAILEQFKQNGWLDQLENGAHLVITGGEPLLQQEALTSWVEDFKQELAHELFIEIETNATYLFNERLLKHVSQINASPKFNAINNEVIKQLSDLSKAFLSDFAYGSIRPTPQVCFKFVMNSADDVNTVIALQNRFEIPTQNIWLMPEGITPKTINQKSEWVIEACQQYGFHFSPRLHIMLWGNVNGK